MWQLSSDETYLQYCCPTFNDKTVIGSVSNRVLQSLPNNNAEKMDEIISRYMDFWNQYCCNLPIPDDVPDLSRYKGHKLRKYLKALESASSENPFYSTFLKNESLPIENLTKKPVRMIQPNTPKFNVTYLNFFHLFEENLLSATDKRDGMKIFAKGSNLEERGKVIEQLRKKYKYVIPIDFKNFDAHHRTKNYEGEMRFYGQLGLPPKVVHSLINAHKSGVIEVNFPCRCSGDLFTGSGNCLVVASLLHAFFNQIRIYCDGDDTLIFTDNQRIISDIVPYLYERGYELTADEIIKCESDSVIPFCQVEYDYNGNYKKDPVRILSKASNITLSIDADIAHVIYGKMQGLAVWKKVGINFVELSNVAEELIEDIEDGSDNYYKLNTLDGRVSVDNLQDVHLTGMFLEICQRTNKILDNFVAVETLLQKHFPIRKLTRAIKLKVLKEVIRRKVSEVKKNNTIEYVRESFGNKYKVQQVEISYLTNQISLYGLTQLVVCMNNTESITSPWKLYQHMDQWSVGHTALQPTTIQKKEQQVTTLQKCKHNSEPYQYHLNNKRQQCNYQSVTSQECPVISNVDQPKVKRRTASMSVTTSEHQKEQQENYSLKFVMMLYLRIQQLMCKMILPDSMDHSEMEKLLINLQESLMSMQRYLVEQSTIHRMSWITKSSHYQEVMKLIKMLSSQQVVLMSSDQQDSSLQMVQVVKKLQVELKNVWNSYCYALGWKNKLMMEQMQKIGIISSENGMQQQETTQTSQQSVDHQHQTHSQQEEDPPSNSSQTGVQPTKTQDMDHFYLIKIILASDVTCQGTKEMETILSQLQSMEQLISPYKEEVGKICQLIMEIQKQSSQKQFDFVSIWKCIIAYLIRCGLDEDSMLSSLGLGNVDDILAKYYKATLDSVYLSQPGEKICEILTIRPMKDARDDLKGVSRKVRDSYYKLFKQRIDDMIGILQGQINSLQNCKWSPDYTEMEEVD
jgi:hypothetical protein